MCQESLLRWHAGRAFGLGKAVAVPDCSSIPFDGTAERVPEIGSYFETSQETIEFAEPESVAFDNSPAINRLIKFVGSPASSGLVIEASPGFIGEGRNQVHLGVEEMIRRAEDVAALFAGGLETAADFGPGRIRRAIGKEVKLIKATDHADPITDAAFGHSQVGVAAHSARGEGFQGVGLHVGQAFQERHHPAASVVDDPLASRMGRRDDRLVVGGDELVEDAREMTVEEASPPPNSNKS